LGQISISPVRIDLQASTFRIEVYKGGPTNEPVDFVTNPPVFSSAAIFGPSGSGNVFILTNLVSDLYSIIAEDDFGCKSIRPYFLPYAKPPKINYNVLDSRSCDPALPNGSVSGIFAQAFDGFALNQTKFQFKLYVGTNVDPVTGNLKETIDPTTILGGPKNTDCNVNPNAVECSSSYGSQANLGANVYTLAVSDNRTIPGCLLYETFEVKDISKQPDLTALATSNTNCISNFNGQLAVTVKKAAGDLNPFATTYDITANSNPITSSSVPDGTTINIANLAPGNYVINATDPLNFCTTEKEFTIIDAPNIPKLIASDLTIAGAEFCDPLLEETAGATVNNVRRPNNAIDPIGNFSFTWTNTAGSVIVSNKAPLPLTAKQGGEEIFNIPGGGQLAAGTVTIGDYFVSVKKIADSGNTGGLNCTSAPLKATIPDKRVNPTITLSGTSDTSCNPSVFEGTLTAVVSTASGIGTGKNY
ncbi:MAG: hypothetical protein ACKOAR_06055, partial [Bacteroidota bacterium]